ncbi:MAG: hypothetical protein AB7V08_08545 [Elusimicrobiales bacterium]
MKGILPVGVAFAGGVHREFELRPELVEDVVEVYGDPARGARAEKNKVYAGVCLLARRLVKLGDIPAADITPELLMKMDTNDFTAMREADARGALLPGQEGA